MAAGIEVRHARACRSLSGGRCNCEPTYRASVWHGRERKRVRRAFDSHAEAVGWRKDAQIALRRGRAVSAPSGTTLREAAAQWLEGAASGAIRSRSRDVYKPSAVRSYELSLRKRVLPTFGDEPLEDIRRADLQELIDTLHAEGLAESTIECALIPLRAIYRREVARGRLTVNPTSGLELPRAQRRRERIADPAEAARLLVALPDGDRPIWATAMYAGLRRGELKALRVSRLDVKAGVIRVERGWDDKAGEIETKGRNRRRVPIPGALREVLLPYLMQSGRRGDELLFGRTASDPFDPRRLSARADDAWKAAQLTRITLHECRHSFASLMIAAGVNAKALSTYLGHGSIAITFDRYGHLMPGNEEQAAGMLDAYLASSTAVVSA